MITSSIPSAGSDIQHTGSAINTEPGSLISRKPHINSSEYQELINKFCFVRHLVLSDSFFSILTDSFQYESSNGFQTQLASWAGCGTPVSSC
jgi:hypothetical protein